jgi:putative DNA primase/helicase
VQHPLQPRLAVAYDEQVGVPLLNGGYEFVGRIADALAETEHGVIVDPSELDADPCLFNAANGTIDLRTGRLREHRRQDLLIRITSVAYQPDTRSELWEWFLERITGGDNELAGFLARAVGYSLTGHTSEEVLFFAHGPSATGKSSSRP